MTCLNIQECLINSEEFASWGIAVFTFVLGFIHEEEFALSALCLEKLQCLEIILICASP